MKLVGKKKICFVAAIEWQIIWFLLEHIKVMKAKYEISVVMNSPGLTSLDSLGDHVPVFSIGIVRHISILKDIKAVFDLFRLFRRERFDIVHSISPKSGLLAMVAGFLAGTKIRIHIYTGQVWATKFGFMKRFLRMTDKVTASLATHILVDSNSQLDFLIKEKVISKKKSSVLAKGSVCGVNFNKFLPDQTIKHSIRQKLSLNESDVVFLFLGRLKNDKGVLDMAKAFSKISTDFQSARLLFVGPDEENIRPKLIHICSACAEKIRFVDYTLVPEHYIASADVLCLPSYREGFGQVIIEAAAVGVPSIGSRIYGITDAIEDGKTGLLYEVGNIEDFADKITQLIKHPSLRIEMGKYARERALKNFSTEALVSAMIDYYKMLLMEKKLDF